MQRYQLAHFCKKMQRIARNEVRMPDFWREPRAAAAVRAVQAPGRGPNRRGQEPPWENAHRPAGFRRVVEPYERAGGVAMGTSRPASTVKDHDLVGAPTSGGA